MPVAASRTIRRALRAAAVLPLLLAAGADGRTGALPADQKAVDVQNSAFIAEEHSTRVGLNDIKTDTLSGSVDAGLQPTQIALSTTVLKLAAIDGHDLHIVDLTSREVQTVPLDSAAERIVISSDGLTAAVDDQAKRIVAMGKLVHDR